MDEPSILGETTPATSYQDASKLFNAGSFRLAAESFRVLASRSNESLEKGGQPPTVTNDAFGRMVENQSRGIELVYSPADGSVLAAMQGQSLNTAFVPLPGGTTAGYGIAGDFNYFYPDWLGSVRLLSGETRIAFPIMAYAPFGEGYAGGIPDNAEFTAGGYPFTVFDSENDTGTLEDFMFRRYSPVQGRWISPDPAGLGTVNPANPQSWNRYAYVLNNPLRNTDPLGLYCFYGGKGDTPENDADKTDYDFDATDASDCGDGGQWIDTTVTINVSSASPSDVQTTAGTVQSSIAPGAANNVSKQYGLTTPCGSSAGQVMGAVEGNFAQFGNYSRWGGLESVTFSPPSGMGAGSTIPISVSVFGFTQNLSVNVQSMNSQSMTFTTNPGHLLYPASITFASSPASPGSINFNINLGGTVANPMEFSFGGSAFEDAQWNHFLGRSAGSAKEVTNDRDEWSCCVDFGQHYFR